jgi:carbon-monoxide dehydrogenase medium subunit
VGSDQQERLIMHAFLYAKPSSLNECLTLLADADAKPLSGGQTLLPTLRQGLAQPEQLVDLKALTDLSGIKRAGNQVIIGALTRHAEVAGSALVQSAIPALASLAGGIGDTQVRHRGTLGGSIANADPAADYPSAVLGLGATIRTSSREIPADEFFTEMFETALQPGELVLGASFPIPKRAGYASQRSSGSRFALVGVFVAETASGVRVAVTGAGRCVFRLGEAEKRLTANFAPAALDGLVVPAAGLNSDLHAHATYRAHLVGVIARRAVAAALA